MNALQVQISKQTHLVLIVAPSKNDDGEKLSLANHPMHTKDEKWTRWLVLACSRSLQDNVPLPNYTWNLIHMKVSKLKVHFSQEETMFS